MNCRIWISAAIMSAAVIVPALAQSLPDAIAAKGETVVLTVHAEGAQVYDCKAGEGGKLAWQFREPVATLIADGKTVGRHYLGPTWEHADGSRVVGTELERLRDLTLVHTVEEMAVVNQEARPQPASRGKVCKH